jgi:uncharacterized tellurite resistance protein B-like protein/uncharacterized Zn finger protein (UPF0148 family)
MFDLAYDINREDVSNVIAFGQRQTGNKLQRDTNELLKEGNRQTGAILEELKKTPKKRPRCPSCGDECNLGFDTCPSCKATIGWLDGRPYCGIVGKRKLLEQDRQREKRQLEERRLANERGQKAEKAKKDKREKQQKQQKQHAENKRQSQLRKLAARIDDDKRVWRASRSPLFWSSYAVIGGSLLVLTVLSSIGVLPGVSLGVLVVALLCVTIAFVFILVVPIVASSQTGRPDVDPKVFRTLLKAFCCMMAADGKIVADEEKATRAILKRLSCPLTHREVSDMLHNFRGGLASKGLNWVVNRTAKEIRRVLSSERLRDAFRKLLWEISTADGDVTQAEKVVARQMLEAIGPLLEFDQPRIGT